MAIVDDYAAIAAQLRRIQAERASQEECKPSLSVTRAGPCATVRAIQIAIRSAAACDASIWPVSGLTHSCDFSGYHHLPPA